MINNRVFRQDIDTLDKGHNNIKDSVVLVM